jgi:hypothetical protein
MRVTAISAILVAMSPVIAAAQTASAPAAVAAAQGHYSITDTDIGTLLDDPAAKAVLDKDVPSLSKGAQIDMARSMTLKSVQQYAPDQLPDKALAQVQVDLNALPAKK